MTWLLIAAALIWCPTYIGLRRAQRSTEALSSFGMAMRQLAEAMAAANRAAPSFGAALKRLKEDDR